MRVASCLTELVSFSIFPSPDQELNPSVLPAAHNTGGSLPDLTNIQFPPPLSTPLDPEDTVAFPSLSSSNSTGSLTTNLTHLGISAASHGNNLKNFAHLSVQQVWMVETFMWPLVCFLVRDPHFLSAHHDCNSTAPATTRGAAHSHL